MIDGYGKKVSLVSALAAVAMGCSGGTSEPPSAVAPPPSASQATVLEARPPRSFAGEPVKLSAGPLPAKLSLDGSVSEWGVDPKRNVVVVGIDKTKVVLAIGWAEEKRPVVSLALASPVPLLPEIGWVQRGGTTHELTDETCKFEQIPLIEAGWQNGRAHPPEVAKACLEILARYGKASAAYRERFIRRLKIDGAAVSLVDAAGASKPLAGAVVHAGETSVEVELPLTALPDTQQAPLAYLYAGVAHGELQDALHTPPSQPHPSLDEAPAADPAWRRLELASPVGFGEHPDVLASVLAEPSGVLNGGIMAQLSYSPARPATLSTMTVPDVAVTPSKIVPKVPGAIGGPTAPDRPALFEEVGPLFVPLETFGKVTLGLARGSVITLVGGKLVAESGFSQPEATQPRGDDLHLFKLDVGGFNFMTGYNPPAWQAVAVKADGKLVEISDESPDSPGMHDAWDGSPKPFNSPDWTSFGLRGKRGGKPKVVTWTWDAKAARYTVSVVPSPASP